MNFDGLNGSAPDVARVLAELAATPLPNASLRDRLPLLQEALLRTRATLPAQALADALAITYQRATSNARAARIALEELSLRGDEAAELAFIKTLIRALKSYDSGHRPYEETVFDYVVDVALPRFCPRAIAALVPHLNAGHLDDDGFGALIEPALQRLTGAARDEFAATALGDHLFVQPVTVSAQERETLRSLIVEGTLEPRGDSEVFRLLHAKVLGAAFSPDILRSYVRQCSAIRGSDLDVRALVWQLGETDFSALRDSVHEWAAASQEDKNFGHYTRRNLSVLFHHASWRDDEAVNFEESPLLAQFAQLASDLEPKEANEILRERVELVVYRLPSREVRARHWLTQATEPLKVDRVIIKRLIAKLERLELDEAIVGWHPLLQKVRGFDETEVLPAVVCAAARLGHAQLVETISSQVPGDIRARAECLLSVHQGDVAAAKKAYRTYLEAGGDMAFKQGERERPWVERAIQALPGLADEVATCRALVQRAAFEGVPVHFRGDRVQAFQVETPDEAKVVALLRSRQVDDAWVLMCKSAPRMQSAVREAIIAGQAPVKPAKPYYGLSGVLRTLREAGNTQAVLSWAKALPWLPADDLEDILSELFAASRSTKANIENELLAFVPTSPTSTPLCLELARVHARRHQPSEAVAMAERAMAHSEPPILAVIEEAHLDEDLKHVAPQLGTLLRERKTPS